MRTVYIWLVKKSILGWNTDRPDALLLSHQDVLNIYDNKNTEVLQW